MGKLNGMFFATSGFFIVSIVLVLALFVSLTLLQSSERLTESGGLERIYILDKSLERTISKIDSGIEVDIDTIKKDIPSAYRVNITETLGIPFSNYGTDFYSSLLELETYIENDQAEISIDPSIVYNGVEKIPIILEPHNIPYTHVDKSGITGLEITPPNMLVFRYDIYLHLLDEKIDPRKGIEWVTQAAPGSLKVVINAVDKEGYRANSTQNISRTDLNQFKVASCDLDFNKILPTSYELACDYSTISTTIVIPRYMREIVTANYPKKFVTFDFDILGIYKNDSTQIA